MKKESLTQKVKRNSGPIGCGLALLLGSSLCLYHCREEAKKPRVGKVKEGYFASEQINEEGTAPVFSIGVTGNIQAYGGKEDNGTTITYNGQPTTNTFSLNINSIFGMKRIGKYPIDTKQLLIRDYKFNVKKVDKEHIELEFVGLENNIGDRWYSGPSQRIEQDGVAPIYSLGVTGKAKDRLTHLLDIAYVGMPSNNTFEISTRDNGMLHVSSYPTNKDSFSVLSRKYRIIKVDPQHIEFQEIGGRK